MSLVRVKNNAANIKGLGMPDGTINLMPGVNEIALAEWDKVKSHPVVAFWLKEGEIEVVSDPKKPLPPFGEIPMAEALALVNETFRVDLLNEWRANEKRGGVLAAIEEQLKIIEDPSYVKE